ncbi:MAG: polymerase [Chlamydiales bacterium]|jgi:DNA polymerase-1|nr:polymerase [Chlamydiales bacterium]
MTTFLIIDALNAIFRSYYALPKMDNGKGQSTQALYGFIRGLLRLIEDLKPSHIVVVFDGPNNGASREALYADYKSHRQPPPEDLPSQIKLASRFCDLMGIAKLSLSGVEADDTIGTLALWGKHLFEKIYIYSADKDLCQLVEEKVMLLQPNKERLLGRAEVYEDYGVFPEQIVDYLALIGDASDNIPGVAGIGPKTASALLKQFGSLDALLENPEKGLKGQKLQKLLEQKDMALLSQKLAMLNTECPIPKDVSFYTVKGHDDAALREFTEEMRFKTLAIAKGEGNLSSDANPDPKPATEDGLYHLVNDTDSFEQLMQLLGKQQELVIDLETSALHPLKAKIAGIGLGYRPKESFYVPLNGQIDEKHVLTAIKELVESPTVSCIGHNIKYDYQVLLNYGIRLRHISFDTLLASYLLNTEERQHSLDHLSLKYFQKSKIPIDSLIGKGKQQISMLDVPLEQVAEYCGEDVDYTWRLKEVLAQEIQERKLEKLLLELELPLLPVLAKMERAGMYVDCEFLKELAQHFLEKLKKIEEEIFAMAGCSFNLNSPKQLSEVLFDKMQIMPPKKTATGYSTDAAVLELLQDDHPIASRMLEYRSLEKLRSTYAESLPKEVLPSTGRIHCTLNQSVAATGRLSCQNPNLQNIPVRGEEGAKIREAFRPQRQGWSYLSADYSQIELRLLAHLSEDPRLMQAFRDGEDVHRYTASLIFDLPLDQVTPEKRYLAKAVNFGVLYGQQAFSLARELKSSMSEAKEFIRLYFQRYQQVHAYLNDLKEMARRTKKAVTLTGRERPLFGIDSKNGMVRSQAERLAINTPIQGTAADLIKLAMLQVDKKLSVFESQMILQIHDELLFEAPDHELAALQEMVRPAMEGVWQLKVPLIVDISIGKNWREC